MSSPNFFGPPPPGRLLSQLNPSEDAIFALLWQWFGQVLPAEFMSNVFRGHQNLTPTPSLATSGSAQSSDYVVIVPGAVTRTDQIRHVYNEPGSYVEIQRGSVYAYQVDCYGPGAPSRANGLAIAWRSGWAADWFKVTDARTAPLFADEPQQLNIINGELQFEQRYMLRLHMHVMQSLRAPQDFTLPGNQPPVDIKTPADLLPP